MMEKAFCAYPAGVAALCLRGGAGPGVATGAQQAEAALEEESRHQSALMENHRADAGAFSGAGKGAGFRRCPPSAPGSCHKSANCPTDVRRNLTFLPLSHEAMAPTLVFANQLAEYAGTLLPVLVVTGHASLVGHRTAGKPAYRLYPAGDATGPGAAVLAGTAAGAIYRRAGVQRCKRFPRAGRWKRWGTRTTVCSIPR